MAQKSSSKLQATRTLDRLVQVGSLAVATDEASRETMLIRGIPLDFLSSESDRNQAVQRLRTVSQTPWSGGIQFARVSSSQGQLRAAFKGSSGTPLSECLAASKEPAAVLRKLTGVAESLDMLHGEGYVHGDVGSNSIFESGDGKGFEILDPRFHRAIFGWSGGEESLPTDGRERILLNPALDALTFQSFETDRLQFAEMFRQLNRGAKFTPSEAKAVRSLSCRQILRDAISRRKQVAQGQIWTKRFAGAAVLLLVLIPLAKAAWGHLQLRALDQTVDAAKQQAIALHRKSFEAAPPSMKDVPLLAQMASVESESSSIYDQLRGRVDQMRLNQAERERRFAFERYVRDAAVEIALRFAEETTGESGVIVIDGNRIATRGGKKTELVLTSTISPPPAEVGQVQVEFRVLSRTGEPVASAKLPIAATSSPERAAARVACSPPEGGWAVSQELRVVVMVTSEGETPDKGTLEAEAKGRSFSIGEYGWTAHPPLFVTVGGVKKSPALFQRTGIELAGGQKFEIAVSGTIRPWTSEAYEQAFGIEPTDIGPNGVSLAKNTACYGFYPEGKTLLRENAGALLFRTGEGSWQLVSDAASPLLVEEEGELQFGINSVKYRETASGRVDGDKPRFSGDKQLFWEDNGKFEVRVRQLSFRFPEGTSPMRAAALSKTY